MTSNQFIEDCLARNQEFLTRANNALTDINEQKFNRRTLDGEWSPAQVVKHLLLSNASYGPLLTDALRKLPLDPTNQEVKFSTIGKTIAKFAGPGTNTPAPKAFVPPEEAQPLSIIQDWVAQHQKIVAFIESAKGKDLNQKCMNNPMLKLFRMSLGDAFLILTQHNERHIQQIVERAAGSC